MSINHYLPAAQNVARSLPGLLAAQGLNPLISRFVLTESERGDAWLFVTLDDRGYKDLTAYAAAGVLDTLSAALYGHKVMFSHSYGLRYAILLGSSNKFPDIKG